MPSGQCHVGTSGWSYPHWAKGRFYPKGLKQGEWLAYFASQFDTVEVNMSFYRLPPVAMIERWRQVTGPCTSTTTTTPTATQSTTPANSSKPSTPDDGYPQPAATGEATKAPRHGGGTKVD